MKAEKRLIHTHTYTHTHTHTIYLYLSISIYIYIYIYILYTQHTLYQHSGKLSIYSEEASLPLSNH